MCSAKIDYVNTLHWGQIAAKKRNVSTLNSTTHIRQKRYVTCVAGQNDSKELYRASSESCQPNGTKLKESIFKSNNKINSTVTTRT